MTWKRKEAQLLENLERITWDDLGATMEDILDAVQDLARHFDLPHKRRSLIAKYFGLRGS